MPVIRQNKILENNPDSIYSVSKQLSTMALRNMSNNMSNPDTSIASAIILKDDVKDDSNDFIAGLNILETNLQQIIAYVNQSEKMTLQNTGRTFLYPDPKNLNKIPNYNPVSGAGRKKGSKNKPKNLPLEPSLLDADNAEENMDVQHQQQDLIGNEWADFYANMGSAPIEPLSSVAIGKQEYPEYPDAVEESDDEVEAISGELDTPETIARDLNPPNDSSDDEDDEDDFIFPTTNENPLINSMVRVSELITRLNVNFNGKIKRNINMLDKLDVQSIANESENVARTFNKIKGEYIGFTIENGDIFYETMLSRMNKLRTDILIAVKSYAPKRQQGGMMSQNMMSRGGVISGGSYATSPMGYNSPVIPTIYNSYVRNCPTKYLM